jgi:hypothetical protein
LIFLGIASGESSHSLGMARKLGSVIYSEVRDLSLTETPLVGDFPGLNDPGELNCSIDSHVNLAWLRFFGLG